MLMSHDAPRQRRSAVSGATVAKTNAVFQTCSMHSLQRSNIMLRIALNSLANATVVISSFASDKKAKPHHNNSDSLLILQWDLRQATIGALNNSSFTTTVRCAAPTQKSKRGIPIPQKKVCGVGFTNYWQSWLARARASTPYGSFGCQNYYPERSLTRHSSGASTIKRRSMRLDDQLNERGHPVNSRNANAFLEPTATRL